jgi:lipid A ethanolaminephosphotransferase
MRFEESKWRAGKLNNMKYENKGWRPEWLLLLVSVGLVVLYNAVFWRRLVNITHPDSLHAYGFLIGVFLFLVIFFNIVLSLLPFRWIGRPLLSLILPLAALTTYFMMEYGVAIDSRMIQNVFETDFNEAKALFTWKGLLYFLLLGVLPVVLLWRASIRRLTWKAALKARGISIGISMLVIALIAMVFYQSFATVLRNNRDIRYYLVPNNYLKGVMDYFHDSSDVPVVVAAIGTDAHRPAALAQRPRKTLVVLVIGETARAANFSLDGYARDTNPELSKQAGLINFSQAHSCGTETAVSLPCLLSDLGHENYSLKKASGQENLLDVVKRSGVHVLWVENQSGCKRTCDRVERINTTDMKVPLYCANGECHDEILIDELRKYADTMKEDSLVVLHEMGSHGPAYYQRYPAAFQRFTPVCNTNLLDKCSKEQMVNAYDNTILYTDHVLSSLIDTLRSYSGRYDTAMMYMSDHGESLGEYGLYLHGAPYVLAPDFQRHIPAIVWLSPGFQESTGIHADCVAKKKDEPISHDNIFHSILGLLDIQTNVYKPDLDLFAHCK